MKPIAIDLGKAYWVIARTDESGQPTVAGLGDGGLIPALVTEYEGQLMVGQQVEPTEGVPYLRDCYQWALGGSEIRKELGQFMRDGADGSVEVFLANQWWPVSALLARMFGDTTKVVKDYLAPNSSLPVVVAVPPDIDRRLLAIYRKSMEDAGLMLAGWCPTPLALAFGDSELLHREHAIAATLIIDWGFITLGIVEVRDRFAQLRVSRNLEWSWQQWGQQLPLEQVAELVDEVMSMAQEYWGIEASSIDRLLIGGEEAWIHQLYPLLQEKIPATFTPFHQPRLAMSMGTALFAEMLHEGLALAPVQSPTSSTQISLTGFAVPGAQIEVRGGAQDEFFTIDLTGIVEHPVTLIPDQNNELSLSIRAGDGRHFAMFLEVEHRSDVVVSGTASSELKSYAGESSKSSDAVPLPGWSGSSQTALDPNGEAPLLMEDVGGEAPLLMEDVGESTAEDLEVPDELKDAPKSPVPIVVDNPGPAPLDEDLGDRTTFALAVTPEEVDGFGSFGEGDGETRILTTESYAKLGLNLGEKKATEEPTGQEEGVEAVEDLDIIEAIEDQDSIEIVGDLDIIESVEEIEQHALNDDEIEKAIGALEPEKSVVGILAISEDELPTASIPEAAPKAIPETPEPEVVLSDTPPEVSKPRVSMLATPPPPSPSSTSLQEQAAALVEKQESNRRNQLGLESTTTLQEGGMGSLPFTKEEPSKESVVAKENGVPGQSEPAVLAPLHQAPPAAASVGAELDPDAVLEKIASARRIAMEARALMEESRALVEDLESTLGPSLFALVWQDEDELEEKPLELGVRREARKILELAKQLTDVESNRLPTSSRKTLQRLTKELESQLQEEDGRIPIRLALQLANRMFELIRRDLRPW